MAPIVRILKYKISEQWRETGIGVKRVLFSMLVVGTHLFIYTSQLGSKIESECRAGWFALRGPMPTPQSVTVVRLDSEALNAIKLPTDGMIPRRVFAEALSKITAAGAKMVMLDFFFLAEGADTIGDESLASALANSPSVIGRSFSPRTDSDPLGRKKEILAIERPLKIFADSAKAVVPLQVQLSESHSVEKITLPEELLEKGDTAAPLLRPLRNLVNTELQEPGEDDLINFYGEPSSITNLSLANLIDPHPQPSGAYFRDRVVFIGPAAHAAPGVPGKDSFKVPSSSAEMYGVEIHATIVANLLDGTWIRRASSQVETIILNLAALVISVLLFSFELKRAAFAQGLAIVIWGLASFLGFTRWHIFLPGATLFVVVLPISLFVRWLIERRNPIDL